MSGEIKQCPHCPVKGFGVLIERHIFRCGHGIPISTGKKPDAKNESSISATRTQIPGVAAPVASP